MATSTDRIEKSVLLHATRERVWRAISDSKQFGSWFGVEFNRPFVAGATIVGKLVGTTVDAEVAKRQGQHSEVRFEFAVDRVEPMRFFFFSMASIRHGFERRLLERAVDARCVRSRRSSGRHEVDRHRVGFRSNPDRAARQSVCRQ